MPPVPHRLGVLAIALLALALGLALSPPAHALKLLSTSDAPEVARFQTWVDASAMPPPPVSLYVVLECCPVAISDGCIVHEPQATVYLGSFVQDRPTLLHEVGHAFDATELTDADRAAFQATFRDTRAWRSPPNSPHERFAEADSLCPRGPPPAQQPARALRGGLSAVRAPPGAPPGVHGRLRLPRHARPAAARVRTHPPRRDLTSRQPHEPCRTTSRSSTRKLSRPARCSSDRSSSSSSNGATVPQSSQIMWWW